MPRYLIPAFIVLTAPDEALANEAAAQLGDKIAAERALDGRRLFLCTTSPTHEIPEDGEPPSNLAGLTCDTRLLVDGVEAAQAVVENWDTEGGGDLAGAVEALDGWIAEAEEHIGAGPMPMGDDPSPSGED